MSIFVDIEKRLGSFVLKMKFDAGDETLALLGASGCGKSMTLKCIAGIVTPDRGKIVVNDRTLFDSEKKIDLSPQERRTGLMFQSYALFPNMTVAQNIRAGAGRERDRAKREERVSQIMKTFDIAALAHRYPRQLSGGQQQYFRSGQPPALSHGAGAEGHHPPLRQNGHPRLPRQGRGLPPY